MVAQLQLRRKIANSTLTQVITLNRSSRRLDFKTTIDWQERHKLLKVAFPINIHATEAIHEIQFGYLRRLSMRFNLATYAGLPIAPDSSMPIVLKCATISGLPWQTSYMEQRY